LTDTKNNIEKNNSSSMSDLEALKTIEKFLNVSDQHIKMLKRNLVGYAVRDSSSSSEEDKVSPSESGRKRKFSENRQKEEENVSVKKWKGSFPDIAVTVPVDTRCVIARKSLENAVDRQTMTNASITVPVDTRYVIARKSLDSTGDRQTPTTANITRGSVDTRCVTARKSLDGALEAQRIVQTFESKHYGRKNIEIEEGKELYNHSPTVNPPKKLEYNSVAKSPKCILASPVTVNPLSGIRAVNEKRTPKLSASVGKLHTNAETKTAVKIKDNFTGRTLSSTLTANGHDGISPKSSVTLSTVDEHASCRCNSARCLSLPKKFSFCAGYGNSMSSPQIGRQETAMNDKLNRVQTQSVPDEKLSSSDKELQTSHEPSNIYTDSPSVTGWALRLRFYQKSRLSTEFSPQAFSLNWKENFMKAYKEYSVPYFDSHCHIDFLFNRQRFCGSWSRFKAMNKDTFPDNFAGCVAVFCNPLTFKPEGIYATCASLEMYSPLSTTPFVKYSLYCANGIVGNGNKPTI
jgi:hypothetical protein